ncbi:hypothetical protein C8R43DRAFT_1211185 [Mycena crocata]|nr:hypothetical protein C8R43DRAFT_1211185 [Mycena crocata]
MTTTETIPQLSLDDLLDNSIFSEPSSYDIDMSSSLIEHPLDFDGIFAALDAISMNPPPSFDGNYGMPIDQSLDLQAAGHFQQDAWYAPECPDTAEFTCMDPSQIDMRAPHSPDTAVASLELPESWASPPSEDSPASTADEWEDVTMSDAEMPLAPSSDQWLRRSTRCTAKSSSSPATSTPEMTPKTPKIARPSTVQTSAPHTKKSPPARVPALKNARASTKPAPNRAAAFNSRPRPSAVKDIPDHYLYLLEQGCTVVGRGMLCNVGGCRQVTRNFADMERHILIHFPDLRVSCHGCPGTFSRGDALKRHLQKKGSSHTNATRKAFLVKFKDLATVVRLKAECPSPKEVNVPLMELFEDLFSASKH